MTPRIGSLFSGAGGLDLAVEAAFGGRTMFGGRTIWHCENNSAASKVLTAHWPGIPNLGDITTVDWSTVEPVDVLAGGFPCQDISAAGRHAGMGAGTRSGLWSQMCGVVTSLRPQTVVVENVRNLLNARANRGVEPGQNDMGNNNPEPVLRGLGAVLGDLADIGYDAQWATVAAADVGAPHKRARVFVVAHPSDQPIRQQSIAGPRRGGASVAGQYHATTAYPAGRRESVALLPTPSRADGDGGHLNRSGARSEELLLPGIARAYANGDLLPTPAAQDGHPRSPGRYNSAGHAATLPGTVRLPPTPTARLGDASGRGASHPQRRKELCAKRGGELGDDSLPDAVARRQWGKYEPAIRLWEQLTRPAPSPTEPNSKGKPRLAAPFAEWMMGWPAGWVTDAVGGRRNDALRIIGNGVVPQQAYAAMLHLLNVAAAAS